MPINNFVKKYSGLNAAQKQAVDTIDGPVMVVAGPGTGKTELLSLRVANILKQTDGLAENILCLTFTESGASAMRERLVGLMGKDAYRVAVHTFHSFGSETIGRYGDFFYSAAAFRPADELSTHQILTDIFTKLPHNNPLASRMNGEYSYLKNVQRSISDFKKSGLTPDEIQRLLRHNQGFLEYAEKTVGQFFAAPMHKSMLENLDELFEKLNRYEALPTEVPNTAPLSEIFLSSLASAIEEAKVLQKVTPITAWRNVWLEKNKKNEFVFKDTARTKKLMAASLVYADYLNAMQAAALYDYDDMILRLTHALEVFPDLKYNLQEQYQYILVDEFQDTNGAQMRILLSLTDNPALENKPNIMVVGDDDQAIYSFQGAEVSNILAFQKQFDPLVVSLRENYRSAPIVLEHARDVIALGEARLENMLAGLDKTPLPTRKNSGSQVLLVEAPDVANEYSALAEAIAARLKNGQAASSIAVLARNHRDIHKILPYLSHHNIPFSYEHQDDIVEAPPVKALVELAQVIVWLAEGRLGEANAHLPELLSHPAWQLAPGDIWRLSLDAYQQNKTWLEVMEAGAGKCKLIAQFLMTAAYKINHQSLEEAIDSLFGVSELTHDEFSFVSPFNLYFFPPDLSLSNPGELIKNINALSHLRHLLRDYAPDTSANLKDFVEFVSKTKAARIRLSLNANANVHNEAVHVMTAHKAKGLEYDTVFIVNSTDQTWGSSSRGRVSRLSYPANLPIAPPGQNEDERLRLFFVAMTRAKRDLIISFANVDAAGKAVLRAGFLQSETWDAAKVETKAESPAVQLEAATVAWQNIITEPSSDLTTALQPILQDYRLSVTHLNSFLDVTRGGPQNFLLQTLLRFPKAISPQAALGSAIHSTLKRAHDHLSATKEKRPLEDILYDFETTLTRMHLSPGDFAHQLQKGSDALQAYLAMRYGEFSASQIGERSFRHQGVVIGEAKLTGIMDVISLNKPAKTITVTDYKTGKPVFDWKGKSDYDKIKLHHYKQQLMFYKLLVENSSEFHGFKVEKGVLDFIEPDPHGDLAQLELSYDPNELAHFTKLIAAVWQRIMRTDFVDTSSYPQSLKGILAFEDYLLEG